MLAMQKWAWFNLAVIGLTLGVVALLWPFGGRGALGGCGFLGLIGFCPLFFRGKPGQVVTDERDQAIWQRAWVLGYAVFWVVFVLAAVFLSELVYGQEGAVPVWIVQCSVFAAFMLVVALASMAILVQYAGGSKDAG